jgi:hypothetical protein
LIVSFTCDAGRRLATSKPEQRWDECPAVSADFDIAWTFITGRVEKLISRLRRREDFPHENLVGQEAECPSSERFAAMHYELRK